MNKNYVGVSDKNLLFINQTWLQSEIAINKRVIFGWFNLLGKLGGITNVMMLLFGFVLFSISEHSYVLKASKKLFIARSRNPNLFKEDSR
jgi:hypothetical protein